MINDLQPTYVSIYLTDLIKLNSKFRMFELVLVVLRRSYC
jgi:sRNA-binding regulator protein Hfq